MQIYDSGDDLEARVEQEAMMLKERGVSSCFIYRVSQNRV
jgi:hypothetical protein